MIFAVAADQTFDYICEADRKSDNPTVFSLRTLTARELIKIEDKVTRLSQAENTGEITISIFSGTQSLLALQAGLRGWSNFCLANGTEVKFEADRSGVPKDETLDMIPAEVRQELSTEILSRSKLSGEDQKN